MIYSLTNPMSVRSTPSNAFRVPPPAIFSAPLPTFPTPRPIAVRGSAYSAACATRAIFPSLPAFPSLPSIPNGPAPTARLERARTGRFSKSLISSMNWLPAPRANSSVSSSTKSVPRFISAAPPTSLPKPLAVCMGEEMASTKPPTSSPIVRPRSSKALEAKERSSPT